MVEMRWVSVTTQYPEHGAIIIDRTLQSRHLLWITRGADADIVARFPMPGIVPVWSEWEDVPTVTAPMP